MSTTTPNNANNPPNPNPTTVHPLLSGRPPFHRNDILRDGTAPARAFLCQTVALYPEQVEDFTYLVKHHSQWILAHVEEAYIYSQLGFEVSSPRSGEVVKEAEWFHLRLRGRGGRAVTVAEG